MTATKTRTRTRTTEIRDGYRLETIPMQGGVWRVNIVDNDTNRLLDARKDLDWNRVEGVKSLLVAQQDAKRVPVEPKAVDPDSLAVRYFRAAKTRNATIEQLQAARELLTAEYTALSEADRNGVEGRAYELALAPVLLELSVRGH